MTRQVKKIRYWFESLFVRFGLWFFAILKLKKASNYSAIIARIIGKKISVNKLAKDNLKKALPNLSKQKLDQIIDEMWDNLGRVVGEFVHIAKKSPQKILENCQLSLESEEVISYLKTIKSGAIIFSGHLGNWEIGPKILLAKNLKVNVVYRPLNNPIVEKLTAGIRGVNLIEKGVNGTRKIIEALARNELVIILADQKISEGQKIKFFHQEAITTTSIARIALKYQVPLIPARVVRINKKFKFQVDIEKPLVFKKTSNINDDIKSLTLIINQTLERWINEFPAQWFWVHNRWKN